MLAQDLSFFTNPPLDGTKLKRSIKYLDEYKSAMYLKPPKKSSIKSMHPSTNNPELPSTNSSSTNTTSSSENITSSSSNAIVPFSSKFTSLTKRQKIHYVDPEYHAQWKLYRVIQGHLGWVRAVAVEPQNEWFVTGASDRTIKIWDLASGTLKLTLTGHISTVRALQVSKTHTYMYSAGEDKKVLCWDLECNKVIRSYHGHRSGVYCMAQHPNINILFTGSRDSSCRVWDIRTKAQIHCLTGHNNTVAAVVSQSNEPQVITGSHDNTVRLWDLAAGKTVATLTHHKKAVRALVIHPFEYTFASASSDNIKVFQCPEGKFLRNFSGHNAIVNSLAINHDNVLVSGADNGTMNFWDWKSSFRFQNYTSQVQPGSLEAENGVFAMSFDISGTRLISCEADKTIKIYKEDTE